MLAKPESVKSGKLLRDNIASFGGRDFTTTELRNICCSNSLKTRLISMAENGEIKHLGKTKSGCRNVDVWREVRLVYPQFNSQVVSKQDDKPINLEGLREVFPDLFADIVHPWMPAKGVISNFSEM